MKNIIQVIKLCKPLYKLFILSGFLIILVSLMGLSIPLIINQALTEISLKITNQGGSLDKLYFFIGVTFAVTILNTVIGSISNRLGDHLAGKLKKFLTEQFYDKVLSLPQNYFDSQISGKITNQLSRGINSLKDFANRATNFILPIFLQAFLTIIVLAYYNTTIALLTLILFPIYILISFYSTRQWGKREVLKNQIEDVTRGRFSEVVSNIRLVKSFTNEKNEYDFISNNLEDSNRIYAKQSRDYHLIDFSRNFILNVVFTIILAITFYNAFQGQITFPTLVLIIQLINQIRFPLFGMSSFITQIQEADSGSKEFMEILNLPSVEEYTKKEDMTRITNPVLEFKNVEFKYDTSDLVIDGVSLKIEKNEVVALVGESGAGKSTIVNLILKFYNPTSGTILLNGKDYKDLSHKFIRNNIALVFQDNELFSSTIRENVAYGMQATDEQVISALKSANAYDFVTKLPNGINSEIGERGVRLSGGQKQRIQIARAILKDAPILILDEATSSLDAKSESEVQEALEQLMKDRLVIIIAHRFSTIQNANKVIVLNNKKIEAMGSPQELAAKKGVYSELLNYQIEGNKKLLKKFDILK